MHTVELLEQALELARRAGYRVRQEWLDGAAGGACVIRGQKWMFVDPTRPIREQLGEVLDALWADPEMTAIDIGAELKRELAERPQPVAKRRAA